MSRRLILPLGLILLAFLPASAGATPVGEPAVDCSVTVCASLTIHSIDTGCRSAGDGKLACSPRVRFTAAGRAEPVAPEVYLPGEHSFAVGIVGCRWETETATGTRRGSCGRGRSFTSGGGSWLGVDGTHSSSFTGGAAIVPAFEVPHSRYACTTIVLDLAGESRAWTGAAAAALDSAAVAFRSIAFSALCTD